MGGGVRPPFFGDTPQQEPPLPMGVYIPHFLVTPPTNDLTQHDRSTVYACGVVMLYVDMSFFGISVIL